MMEPASGATMIAVVAAIRATATLGRPGTTVTARRTSPVALAAARAAPRQRAAGTPTAQGAAAAQPAPGARRLPIAVVTGPGGSARPPTTSGTGWASGARLRAGAVAMGGQTTNSGASKPRVARCRVARRRMARRRIARAVCEQRARPPSRRVRHAGELRALMKLATCCQAAAPRCETTAMTSGQTSPPVAGRARGLPSGQVSAAVALAEAAVGLAVAVGAGSTRAAEATA
jgi:hypothetical protein